MFISDKEKTRTIMYVPFKCPKFGFIKVWITEINGAKNAYAVLNSYFLMNIHMLIVRIWKNTTVTTIKIVEIRHL